MPIGLGLGRTLQERGLVSPRFGREPDLPPAVFRDRAIERVPPDPGVGGVFREEMWLPPGIPRSELPEIMPRIAADPAQLELLLRLLGGRR